MREMGEELQLKIMCAAQRGTKCGGVKESSSGERIKTGRMVQCKVYTRVRC